MTLTPSSQQLFERAQKVIPGGVNSPVRAFAGVDSTPFYTEEGQGSHLLDVEGKRYLDFVMSWGPLILGHNPKSVTTRVSKALAKGTSFGTCCPAEVELAEKITAMIPFLDSVRFVNSGTEAVMSAIRLARGFTKRSFILKFDGCYHGHADHLLANAGSGLATNAIKEAAGVPNEITAFTLSVPFNDSNAVEAIFKRMGNDIAAVIVEALPCNMSMMQPKEGFLAQLRTLTKKHDALLIFDEVITGFRLARGGAAHYFNCTPDLATYGKIIGGGFPVGAFGGRADIMAHIAPIGPVYQAGTLSGNPIAMAAGCAVLDALLEPEFYDKLTAKTNAFCAQLNPKEGLFHVASHGSIFALYFNACDAIANAADVAKGNRDHFVKFHQTMLAGGFFFAPSPFEVGFISTQHSTDDLSKAACAINAFVDSLSL